MAYRRSRAEIIAAACVPALTEETSKLFDRITYRHPVGPWTVSIFEPEDRKLVGRRHFGLDQLPLLRAWLRQVQQQFDSVQWFVLSKKNARPLMPADLNKLLSRLRIARPRRPRRSP